MCSFLKVKHFVSRRLQFSSAIPFCASLGSWRVILNLFMPFMTYGGSYCTATLQLLEENFEIATLNDAPVETLGRSRLISYKILIVLTFEFHAGETFMKPSVKALHLYLLSSYLQIKNVKKESLCIT